MIYRHFEIFSSESAQESGNGEVCNVECDSVECTVSESQTSHPFWYQETATPANDTTR
jgi:hypothetical protein